MTYLFSSEPALSAFAESLGKNIVRSWTPVTPSVLLSDPNSHTNDTSVTPLSNSNSHTNDTPPALVFELVGDVGVGKTTFTRALARGLGVTSPVTSPSFSISNRYTFPLPKNPTPLSDLATPSKQPSGALIHYDFYRLSDPGIMSSELSEALTEKNTVIVLEWSDSVKNLLPASRITISFTLLPDESRSLTISAPAPLFSDLEV